MGKACMTTQENSAVTSSKDSGLSSKGLLARELNVLIAEDELVMRRLLKQSMERLGFIVTEAVDGDDALLKFGAQRFHLVMLDVLMPNQCADRDDHRAEPPRGYYSGAEIWR
jgi:CheY-like chemotaxis protein